MIGRRRRNFAAAVEEMGAEPGASPRATLAVLPFEGIGVEAERAYLADGLTEETITVLGQIDPERLGVIGRTSVMAYKGGAKSLAEIGRELGVTYLVESSIRTEGARLRITSKLIRVRDQLQMWAASFDSEPSNMLAFQRELSAAIAQQIRLRLSPERLQALDRRQTRHPEAYDLYLRGRYYWNQLTPPTTREAIRYFTRATELDPGYALAWSGIADAYVASPINGDAPPLQVMPQAGEAAARAVRADPELAEAQTSLGMVKFWHEWDWAGAEGAYRRAAALDPGYDLVRRITGVLFAHWGRHAEAAPELRRARELDPLNPMNYALSSHAAFLAGDYQGALPFARQAIVIDPAFWIGHFLLAQAAERLREDDLALAELEHASRLSGGNSKTLGLRGSSWPRAGARTKHGTCCARWSRSRPRAICRPAPRGSCTWAWARSTRRSSGWSARSPRATCTSCICRPTRSGRRYVPTRASRRSWRAAASSASPAGLRASTPPEVDHPVRRPRASAVLGARALPVCRVAGDRGPGEARTHGGAVVVDPVRQEVDRPVGEPAPPHMEMAGLERIRPRVLPLAGLAVEGPQAQPLKGSAVVDAFEQLVRDEAVQDARGLQGAGRFVPAAVGTRDAAVGIPLTLEEVERALGIAGRHGVPPMPM